MTYRADGGWTRVQSFHRRDGHPSNAKWASVAFGQSTRSSPKRRVHGVSQTVAPGPRRPSRGITLKETGNRSIHTTRSG
jgi:hypothetical protein